MAKTKSDQDLAAMIKKMLGGSAKKKEITPADRALAEKLTEDYMKRNDGGMAKNTRMF
jgi:hypothetical protein